MSKLISNGVLQDGNISLLKVNQSLRSFEGRAKEKKNASYSSVEESHSDAEYEIDSPSIFKPKKLSAFSKSSRQNGPVSLVKPKKDQSPDFLAEIGFQSFEKSAKTSSKKHLVIQKQFASAPFHERLNSLGSKPTNMPRFSSAQLNTNEKCYFPIERNSRKEKMRRTPTKEDQLRTKRIAFVKFLMAQNMEKWHSFSQTRSQHNSAKEGTENEAQEEPIKRSISQATKRSPKHKTFKNKSPHHFFIGKTQHSASSKVINLKKKDKRESERNPMEKNEMVEKAKSAKAIRVRENGISISKSNPKTASNSPKKQDNGFLDLIKNIGNDEVVENQSESPEELRKRTRTSLEELTMKNEGVQRRVMVDKETSMDDDFLASNGSQEIAIQCNFDLNKRDFTQNFNIKVDLNQLVPSTIDPSESFIPMMASSQDSDHLPNPNDNSLDCSICPMTLNDSVMYSTQKPFVGSQQGFPRVQEPQELIQEENEELEDELETRRSKNSKEAKEKEPAEVADFERPRGMRKLGNWKLSLIEKKDEEKKPFSFSKIPKKKKPKKEQDSKDSKDSEGKKTTNEKKELKSMNAQGKEEKEDGLKLEKDENGSEMAVGWSESDEKAKKEGNFVMVDRIKEKFKGKKTKILTKKKKRTSIMCENNGSQQENIEIANAIKTYTANELKGSISDSNSPTISPKKKPKLKEIYRVHTGKLEFDLDGSEGSQNNFQKSKVETLNMSFSSSSHEKVGRKNSKNQEENLSISPKDDDEFGSIDFQENASKEKAKEEKSSLSSLVEFERRKKGTMGSMPPVRNQKVLVHKSSEGNIDFEARSPLTPGLHCRHTNTSTISYDENGKKWVNQYCICKTIGQGGSAKVVLATAKEKSEIESSLSESGDFSNNQFAIKIQKKSSLKTMFNSANTSRALLEKEIAIMKLMVPIRLNLSF